MDAKLEVYIVPKEKVLLWADLSHQDMEEINSLQSTQDLERVLCRVFGIKLPDHKGAILLDLFLQTMFFCRAQMFKSEQTSALLSIIKSVHEANVGTPLNNIEQCFQYCKELLLCHAVRRPPFSISLFSSEEVNSILDYINSNYIRHYKLYKYFFTPLVKLDISLTYHSTSEQNEENPEEDPAKRVEQ